MHTCMNCGQEYYRTHGMYHEEYGYLCFDCYDSIESDRKDKLIEELKRTIDKLEKCINK